MARILFLYSTVDGHTRDICRRMAEVVGEHGHEAALVELTPASRVDAENYDRIVVGASIRYGKHRPEVAAFVNANADLLRAKSGAFFSVNAVARKPEKRDPQTNPYVRKFLASIDWQPARIGIFAGKIDYPRYGFVDRTMIRLIMWMMKGPTDPKSTTDFTDWNQVDEFAKAIAAGSQALAGPAAAR